MLNLKTIKVLKVLLESDFRVMSARCRWDNDLYARYEQIMAWIYGQEQTRANMLEKSLKYLYFAAVSEQVKFYKKDKSNKYDRKTQTLVV